MNHLVQNRSCPLLHASSYTLGIVLSHCGDVGSKYSCQHMDHLEYVIHTLANCSNGFVLVQVIQVNVTVCLAVHCLQVMVFFLLLYPAGAYAES